MPVYSFDDIQKKFSEEVMKKENNDFVEGLMYSENTAVIMTANMTDEADSEKVRFFP